MILTPDERAARREHDKQRRRDAQRRRYAERAEVRAAAKANAAAQRERQRVLLLAQLEDAARQAERLAAIEARHFGMAIDVEALWCGKLCGGRYEDARAGDGGVFRMARPATHVMTQSSAAGAAG